MTPRIASTTRILNREYDLPLSTTPPPPTTQAHKQTRRLSQPTPSTLTNHFTHHAHHGRYSPSSRQSDVSRLLDPAYAPSSPASSTRSTTCTPKAAYVDHHGDLHDPDYRHFPPMTRPTRRKIARPRWETSYAYPYPYAHQEMDQEMEDEEDLEAYQDQDASFAYSGRPRGWTTSTNASSSSTYHPYYHAFPPSPPPLTSTFTYSPPTSLGSDDMVLEEDADSPFVCETEGEEKKAKERERWCPVSKYASRRKKEDDRAPSPVDPAIEEKQDEHRGPRASPSLTAELEQWTYVTLTFTNYSADDPELAPS
jgi:hypothetical protein